MDDPTRPLPNLIPQPDGSWTGRSVLTPTAFNTRGLFTLPSRKVVPVIVVPGIMGSNLRAATSPRKKPHRSVNANESVWRPPNGKVEGYKAAKVWKTRDPATRQQLLDPDTTEVDKTGEIGLSADARSFGITEAEVRERWWGEVHWDSYGNLLYGLQVNLNRTFEMDAAGEVRSICRHWQDVIECDPGRWGVRSIDKVTEAELEKHADYYFPVYACGYNWLESCADSADRLRQRIERIVSFWTERKRECKQVILVTHSMGGLVARACAKQIPEKILGVIHGVMPALGAPACYRRIACGTEKWSPSNGTLENAATEYVADILGDTPQRTMPVMAHSPGALELLPNHLYPQPWLRICLVSKAANKDVVREVAHLPAGDPYGFYRDTKSWYRLFDPMLVDPAAKHSDDEAAVEGVIHTAIDRAEKFHRHVLDAYYHPNTYAFYAADPKHMSFGSVTWMARDPGNGSVFTESNIRDALREGYAPNGARRVRVEKRTNLQFVPARQDTVGDGTVPRQSGSGPDGKIRHLFEIRGFDHQGAFNNESVQLLTRHLIVKLVQEAR
jgi:pimeloyl-ACP methyl ester carboxylesterase